MQDWDAASLLALTAPIETGAAEARPFSHRFVRRLHMEGALVGGRFIRDAAELNKETEERIRALLERRAAAEELIRRYRGKGFSVCIPSDADWPAGLRPLGEREPVILFTAGNRDCFRGRHVSVAGSRDVGKQAAEAAKEVGEGAVAHGCVLTSGNARGIDRICQQAALRAGGKLLLFPATRADIWKEDPRYGTALEAGDLLIATETLPDEPFSAAKALSRNHMIYVMGDPAVVIAARENRGGSWRGAMDCLSHGWAQVLAVTGEHGDFAGCRALLSHGAQPVAAEPGTLWNQIEARRAFAQAPVQEKWELPLR